FPAGRLSDRVDRRYVIAGLAATGVGLCLMASVFLSHAPWLLYGVMFLFGGMTFPLYSLCLAHANDNSSLSLMEIASGVLMMNSLGSIIGPLLVAYLLPWSSYALFIVAAAALTLLTLWSLFRIQQHEVAREHFEPFIDVPKTTHEITELVEEEQKAA
ncbi:MAG: MFS transporter, partial [Pseudomonadales bacterium]|nr:MFS transporter [Pseudomonadales bacterium]